MICNRLHQHQTYLFATTFNNKLPQFVSPFPDPLPWAIDTLRLPWEDLDPYAFPPIAILGKVVAKLKDYPCRRVILITVMAQHTLDLGFGCHVQPDPSLPPQSVQSANSAIKANSKQEFIKPNHNASQTPAQLPSKNQLATEAQTVWFQWLFQPWHPLWINH